AHSNRRQTQLTPSRPWKWRIPLVTRVWLPEGLTRRTCRLPWKSHNGACTWILRRIPKSLPRVVLLCSPCGRLRLRLYCITRIRIRQIPWRDITRTGPSRDISSLLKRLIPLSSIQRLHQASHLFTPGCDRSAQYLLYRDLPPV